VLPPAQHSLLVGHDIADSRLTPLGKCWRAHVLPPLIVASTTPVPAADCPTPQQRELFRQNTLINVRWASPRGRTWEVQVCPASVVATTTPAPDGDCPAAQQWVPSGQETLTSSPILAGRPWNFQVPPPFVVARTDPVSSVDCPTVQQRLAE